MHNKQYKIWYWQKKKNFGDVLNTILFNNVIAPIFSNTDNILKADVIFIGSLLGSFECSWPINKFLHKKLIVAGAGFRDVPQFKYFQRRFDFQIVRGELTKKELKKLGFNIDENVCLGDPGLLASYLLDNMSPIKKYKIGIIPHFRDIQSPVIYDTYKRIPGSTLVNPTDDPLTVIKHISECETIFSSAMHGLIIADSLGIPNQWAENKFTESEPAFKYKDYYSIYSNTDKIEPIQFITFDKEDVKKIKDNYRIKLSEVKIVQEKLIKKLTNIFTNK